MRTINVWMIAVLRMIPVLSAAPAWADGPKVGVSAEAELTAAEAVVAMEAAVTKPVENGVTLEANAVVELSTPVEEAAWAVDQVEASVIAGPAGHWALGVALEAAPRDSTAGIGAAARWRSTFGAWGLEIDAWALAPLAADGGLLRLEVGVSWGD